MEIGKRRYIASLEWCGGRGSEKGFVDEVILKLSL